jgi:hypothetical protein
MNCILLLLRVLVLFSVFMLLTLSVAFTHFGAIVSERGIVCLAEDFLKFVIRNHTILGQVVFLYNILDITDGHIHAQFLHCVLNVLLRDLARSICVKLIKDSSELEVVKESGLIHGGS